MKASLIIPIIAIWIALFTNVFLAKPNQPLFSSANEKVAQSEVIQQEEAEVSTEIENAAEVKELIQAELELDVDENGDVN